MNDAFLPFGNATIFFMRERNYFKEYDFVCSDFTTLTWAIHQSETRKIPISLNSTSPGKNKVTK
jgi:hypothetical protein